MTFTAPRMLSLLLLAAALPCQAQFGDLLKKFAPGAGSAKQGESAASAGMLDTTSSKMMSAAKSDKEIEAELAPDRQCNRPQEKFNIAEKLMEYGGTEAGLRLQRLVESDFKYDDISPADRRMLRYLAQTTVWIPVEVENKLGALFDLAGGNGASDITPLEKDTFEEVRQQTTKFRALTSDFPGEINLALNPELADGAFAKFGGRIQISRNLLQTASEKPLGADLLLAHEMAHVYKRHAVKRMQYELIASRDGWLLGKKLLQRAQRGSSFDPIRDGMFALTVVPSLITFVQNLQLRFSSEQELEADACAAQWLKATSHDPAKAWAEFRGAFAQGSSEQSYAGTHPATEEREANFVIRVNTSGNSKHAAGSKDNGNAPRPPKPNQRAEKPTR